MPMGRSKFILHPSLAFGRYALGEVQSSLPGFLRTIILPPRRNSSKTRSSIFYARQGVYPMNLRCAHAALPSLLCTSILYYNTRISVQRRHYQFLFLSKRAQSLLVIRGSVSKLSSLTRTLRASRLPSRPGIPTIKSATQLDTVLLPKSKGLAGESF